MLFRGGGNRVPSVAVCKIWPGRLPGALRGAGGRLGRCTGALQRLSRGTFSASGSPAGALSEAGGWDLVLASTTALTVGRGTPSRGGPHTPPCFHASWSLINLKVFMRLELRSPSRIGQGVNLYHIYQKDTNDSRDHVNADGLCMRMWRRAERLLLEDSRLTRILSGVQKKSGRLVGGPLRHFRVLKSSWDGRSLGCRGHETSEIQSSSEC